MEILLGLLIFSVLLSVAVLWFLLNRVVKLRMQIECVHFALQGLEGFVAADKATIENLVEEVDRLRKEAENAATVGDDFIAKLQELGGENTCSGSCCYDLAEDVKIKKPKKSRKAIKKGE